MHILIIGDEDRIASLAKQELEEQGHTAMMAYDGLSGKKLALQHDYDLLISDIILPQLTGLELCRYPFGPTGHANHPAYRLGLYCGFC